jgi:hypothetical protein
MSGPFKLGYDISDAPEETKDALENTDEQTKAKTSGIGGDPMSGDPVVKHIQTSTETIIKNNHNSWIILGRDRPRGRFSGYGGAGHTQAASIDMVVGRKGNSNGWSNPDFKKDSARIYISQKTDVDANFGLAPGLIGSSIPINAESFGVLDFPAGSPPDISKVVPRSAIAMKADGIRLIAREGIKLVTGTDSLNSQGGTVRSVAGVNLIAGNDDSDMQPFVKGENLVELLNRIVEHLDAVSGILDAFLTHQMAYNKSLASHFHHGFKGMPTTISPACEISGMKTMVDLLSQVKRSGVFLKTNIRGTQSTYLNQFGDKYINSRFNFTN